MARYDLSFDVEGDTEVVAMFETAGRRVRNLRVPFRKVGDMMLGVIEENYAGRGSVWGKWKRRLHAPADGHPLLEDSRAMRGGFDTNVGSDYVEIGNVENQFKFHQSKKPRSTRLPRRIMMAVRDNQRREAVRILQQYIMEK